MLIDMIHDNHGEPPFKTRYRDPALLHELGYQAIVIPDALAALPGAWRDFSSAGAASEMAGHKPREMEAAIDARVVAAAALGMRIYFYGDALLLPLALVEKNAAAYCCADNSQRLCSGKAAVYEALAAQVRELFTRWPEAAGLIMRVGEVYPEATPHMTGSPLWSGNCAVCREIAPADRLVRFITTMHQTAAEMGKQYIHRAWSPPMAGIPRIHDDPAAYGAISQRLPSVIPFSFKYTPGDFQTAGSDGAAVNPCLLADDRPKWIEFQCEREHEGKGALPNYQGRAWRDFFAAFLRARDALHPEATDYREAFHIWGWSRGGGWGGPYVQREEWIDINVHALCALYREAFSDPAEIATAWVAKTFGVAESSPPAPAIAELLALSPAIIRNLFYVEDPRAGAGGPREPAPHWLTDDVLHVEAIYAAALSSQEFAAAAIARKEEALAGVDRLRQLLEIALPDLPNKSQARELSNSLVYFHSIASTVANLFIGFVEFSRWLSGGRQDEGHARAAIEHLQAAQTHWQMHIQRHALLPGAPSMFHEISLWERTNSCLAKLQEPRA